MVTCDMVSETDARSIVNLLSNVAMMEVPRNDRRVALLERLSQLVKVNA